MVKCFSFGSIPTTLGNGADHCTRTRCEIYFEPNLQSYDREHWYDSHTRNCVSFCSIEVSVLCDEIGVRYVVFIANADSEDFSRSGIATATIWSLCRGNAVAYCLGVNPPCRIPTERSATPLITTKGYEIFFEDGFTVLDDAHEQCRTHRICDDHWRGNIGCSAERRIARMVSRRQQMIIWMTISANGVTENTAED